MSANNFFPHRPAVSPKIYAYEDKSPQYQGLLKVGYTTISVKERIRQQYPTLRPGPLPYAICYEASAMRKDGTSFTDHEVHDRLRRMGIANPAGEWFRCTVREVAQAVEVVRRHDDTECQRTETFRMRPEQQEAVEKTAAYFHRCREENTGKAPHFLWNCKMRFGKTFAAYQLARCMGWKRLLVLTFKPAVRNAWETDLMNHTDFRGWQFISRDTPLTLDEADKTRPLVYFGSFQDLLGRNKAGGIKARNEQIHQMNWDCVILDEYHYGAWRDKTKDLFAAEEKEEANRAFDYYDEDMMPITTDAYLYLSGTPFRAISSGEFIEEQIYNWTYSDEQRAKAAWQGPDNPYAALPRMVMMTYQLPDAIRSVALAGEFNEFDLNTFFKAEGEGTLASFRYKDEVQKWLDLMRGAYTGHIVSYLKLRTERPPMPFSHAPLLQVLSHTLWFLPSVASCYAMRNLLQERQNRFYHDYHIVVAAGPEAGIGADALQPVLAAMDDPLATKTITLSCGKLTTGVTVKPWTGIFMLRNSSSPETYFQAAFRVQSPWTIRNPDGLSPNRIEILKQTCYVFDFAPDRALRQIADYSCRLNVDETNPEKKVEEFIRFLPVLAYDGSHMKQIDAAGVLDMALSGTSATLLARRWESAVLVNVDNLTLQRLMNNPEAMQALMNIEGFRTLNRDIATIINKSDAVKKARCEAGDRSLSREEKQKITQEEKEYKSLRKQIQDKLIKFAARIPVFMYLTDYREYSLYDVITQLEPDLFFKVTGLTLKDFSQLVSLGVFNGPLMNDAIYKFKRYEDASLEYTGINRHAGEDIGLYQTVMSREEYEKGFT